MLKGERLDGLRRCERRQDQEYRRMKHHKIVPKFRKLGYDTLFCFQFGKRPIVERTMSARWRVEFLITLINSVGQRKQCPRVPPDNVRRE
jgi:hypothetical protein